MWEIVFIYFRGLIDCSIFKLFRMGIIDPEAVLFWALNNKINNLYETNRETYLYLTIYLVHLFN